MLIYLMLLESDVDRAKFLQIYDDYHEKLYRVAYTILNSHALAEESVQNTLLKIIVNFEKIKALECKETGAYIVTIVENDALDALKKEQRVTGLDADWDIQDLHASVEGGTTLRQLVEIIKAMPLTYRRILVMKFVWEWADKQIAQELGMTQNVVSTRISRGRAILIETLKKEGYQL